MKKKFFTLLLALIMVFSLSTSIVAAENSDSGNGSTDAHTVNGTTYFYDQFDNSAYRTVYKQINEAARQFHNSTQTASYQDDGYYTAFVLSVSNKDWEVIGAEGMDQVVNAVLADHPEYFWMSDNYVYKQESSGDLRYISLTIECYSLYANGNTRSVYKNNYDMTVQNYAATLDKSATDYEKVYLIHNAIINKVYYASDVTTKNKDNIYAYTADGVFNSKYQSAVTYGYAKAFKAIMDYVGVPCIYIEGQNSDLIDDSVDTQKQLKEESYINNCAWNAVYLNGEWYLINLGLDDPVTTTGKEVLSYTYFNITDEQAPNLTAITSRLPGIPKCTGTEYCLTRVQADLEADGLWQKSSYSFIDKILDKYGLSVVLISIGLIMLLIVSLIKHIHKKSAIRKKSKVKKTKTTVVDNSELDEQLRTPPLS
ncbi:MAG: transglutaminase domain-containing protein [Clostridiales bacterium]|nr:transglutaminase domain-containing protein [Clostridiales bacterium]